MVLIKHDHKPLQTPVDLFLNHKYKHVVFYQEQVLKITVCVQKVDAFLIADYSFQLRMLSGAV